MILVTGATGFVGTALLHELGARGLAHRAVSRKPRPGFVTIGDIDAHTDWQDALGGVSVVVHLAARVHQMNESAAEADMRHRAANVDATLNLASQAASAGVRRFIFISSIKANGEETRPGRPFTADDTPKPVDAYGRSKVEAERGLRALGRETGMEVVIIRPPLIYGPGAKGNFAALVNATRRGVPLPFGAVCNNRSLVFVGNLVDLIILCLTHPAAPGQAFLVSDDNDLSTAELVRGIAAALERPARLIPVPASLMSASAAFFGKGAMARRLLGDLQVDITKSRELLSWTPPFRVDEALRKTVR